MSILIKGMTMPKNCFLCPLSVLSENRLFCELTSDEVVRAKIDKDCPLVELPPHGRLIDADMLTTVTEMVNGEFKTYIEVFEVLDAPTIIESEG